jgi:hypothetical protein
VKILLTGFTMRQCAVDFNTEQQYEHLFKMVPRALRHAGHEVDQRQVEPGEELRGRYDMAVIGLHAMASMSSSRKYGSIWAATQLPYALMFQDWKVKLTVDHMTTENYLWKSSHISGYAYEMFQKASKYSKLMDRVRARWSRAVDSMIVSMYSWGDPKLLSKVRNATHITRPVAWDTSPWLEVLGTPVPMEQKERRWVAASLSNWDSWLETFETPFTWPVQRVWKPTVGKQVRTGDAFIPERELVQDHYGKSVGVMMPYYGGECLTGWWRSRALFAAQVGSVLLGDQRDLEGFGHGYWHPHHHIEKMSSHELTQVAAHQAMLVKRWTKTKDESAIALDAAIRMAVQEPVRDPAAV